MKIYLWHLEDETISSLERDDNGLTIVYAKSFESENAPQMEDRLILIDGNEIYQTLGIFVFEREDRDSMTWHMSQNTMMKLSGIGDLPISFRAFVNDSDSPKLIDPESGFIELIKDQFSKSVNANLAITEDEASDSDYRCNARQIIYYGAPGTGKSFHINEITDKKNRANVIRTTFHPDSDYASFVGVYKPISKTNSRESDVEPTSIISYEFIPQAFLNAYVRAIKNWCDELIDDKNVYLIIEEINRGNCAQIFGDIFQLLDRKAGWSEYPIEPDKDIQEYLQGTFLGISPVDEQTERLLTGKTMTLPPNLYIYASMNTSDQSLFPMDSAFKRRWSWEYTPIATSATRENKAWFIHADGIDYDWSEFINAINKEISLVTRSEDKKIGHYFLRPFLTKYIAPDGSTQISDTIISAKHFVSKVIFYLMTDVLKGYTSSKLFWDGERNLTFDDFFKTDGSINESLIVKFLQDNLKLNPRGSSKSLIKIIEEDETEGQIKKRASKPSRETRKVALYKINGRPVNKLRYVPATLLEEYITAHPGMTYTEVFDTWKEIGELCHEGGSDINKDFVYTQNEYEVYSKKTKRDYYFPVECKGQNIWIFKEMTTDRVRAIVACCKNLGLGIHIEEVHP